MCVHCNELGIFKMRYTTSAIATLATAIVLMTAPPAFSQQPTEAQRDAIRSACRADYQAHCSSIPPGGAASLQCLQQNMSSLSSSCQGAVRAVEPAAEAKPEAKPEAAPAAGSATATTETAAAPAGKPSNAQISAIRSACRSDYPKVCAGVPTGGAPALQCLEKNKAKLSAGCEKAVAAASGGGAAPSAGGAPAAAATAAPSTAAPAAPAVIVL